jgi:hypothetical protein
LDIEGTLQIFGFLGGHDAIFSLGDTKKKKEKEKGNLL